MTAISITEKITIISNWLGAGSIDLFGLPYAGKDTHGRELAKLLNAPLLGGGDILRSADMPQRIKETIRSGRLLPTKDYLDIVLPHLSNPDFAGKPLILSSVGRWHGEEAGVLEATAQAGHPLRVVIFLNVSETEIRNRWQSGRNRQERGYRTDEEAETLEIRLSEFRDKTLPVISFYRDEQLLLEVDGTPPPAVVLTDIIEALLKLAANG